MSKRVAPFMGLVLVLTMLLGLFPASVSAAESFGLYFANGNAGWSLYQDTTYQTEYMAGKGTTWSVEGTTLVLNNFQFETTALVALEMANTSGLAIRLEPGTTNSIVSISNTDDSRGIRVQGNALSIQGAGTLIVTGGSPTNGIEGTYGISVGSGITIDSSTVIATGGTASGSSIGLFTNVLTLKNNARLEATSNAVAWDPASHSSALSISTLVFEDGSFIKATSPGAAFYGHAGYVPQPGLVVMGNADGNPSPLSLAVYDAAQFGYTVEGRLAQYIEIGGAAKTAGIGDVTVAGTLESAIAEVTATITVSGDAFNPIAAGADVSGWFTNLPASLAAKTDADVGAGSASVTIRFSGIPTAISSDAMAVTIPGSALQGGADLAVPQNANARYQIAGIAPGITTTSLAAGTAGTPYSQTVAATGTAPLNWSIAAGNFPSGLGLDAGTGTITGTPTAAGSYSFTLQVSNNAGTDTRAFVLHINDALASLADPNQNTFSVQGGTTHMVNNSFTIEAAGHRQAAAGAKVGDERYIPLTASANPTVGFSVTDGVYTTPMAISSAGSYTLTVVYRLDRWDGTAWQDTGTRDTKTGPLTIQAPATQAAASTASPQTGDGTSQPLWVVTALVALAVVLILGAKWFRYHSKTKE